MKIQCENCGKKYKFDEDKIKGESVKLRCRECKNVMVVEKPMSEPDDLVDLGSIAASSQEDRPDGDSMATSDTRLEKAWVDFMISFDDAGTARIEADQKQGLIPDIDARPVMFALNRMNAYAIHQAFGQHPRQPKEPVLATMERVWISTLYGSKFLDNNSTPLVRK